MKVRGLGITPDPTLQKIRFGNEPFQNPDSTKYFRIRPDHPANVPVGQNLPELGLVLDHSNICLTASTHRQKYIIYLRTCKYDTNLWSTIGSLDYVRHSIFDIMSI